MLKMTMTWEIYILAVNFATFYGILANQPAGYLGCFLDKYGDSMVNSLLLFYDQSNTAGEYCKRMVRSKFKRYAGTKQWKCYGGDGYKKSRSSTLCCKGCPGNPDEICGDGHLMIIYDTWMCITSPCQNGATCSDINADTFTCHCTEGWTGHFCNETLTSTVTHPIRSSSSSTVTWLSSSSATTNISRLSDNSSGQSSRSLIAVYISVPLAVVIATLGVITFIIIRKRRNQKKGNMSAIYDKSDESIHTFSNTALKDQDTLSDIPVYASVTAENKANAKIVGTIEESENANPDINYEIPVDDNGYGHLKSKTTAVLHDTTYSHTTHLHNNYTHDNTYSHTTHLHNNYTHDNTYSHVDKTTERQSSDVFLNDIDADDTYSHINRPAGKLKPDVNMTATDVTYSYLNKNETKMNKQDMIGNQTEKDQNDPEYDHI